MIIQSLLDTDLYKLTMHEVVWSHFPDVLVEYAFQCRTKDVDLSPYADEIRAELAVYCDLRLTEDEAAYLKSIRYLKPSYVDALSDLRLCAERVQITVHPDAPPSRRLQVRIVGNWFQPFYLKCLSLLSSTKSTFGIRSRMMPPIRRRECGCWKLKPPG